MEDAQNSSPQSEPEAVNHTDDSNLSRQKSLQNVYTEAWGCCALDEDDTYLSTEDSLDSSQQEPISTTAINELTQTVFRNLVKYLNFRDLIQCRHVCTYWNNIIQSSESFLARTMLNATLETQNIDMISKTTVPWTNVRLRYFDFESDAPRQPFSPPESFFKTVRFLEFYKCDIYWDSFKKWLIYAGESLQELAITRSFISNSIDQLPMYPTLDESVFKKTLLSISTLSIVEFYHITELTSKLRKFSKSNEYEISRLRKLRIEFQPHHDSVRIIDANNFSLALADLIKLNSTTLKSLVLNLRSDEIVNAFGPVVLTALEPFYEGLRLTTFKLAQPIPSISFIDLNPNISSSHMASSFLIFLEFLRSQSELTSVGFPHFTNLGVQELQRTRIVDSLNPSRLEKLRIPGHIYLRKNFLKVFTKLKVLFIGGQCGLGCSSSLNPTKYMYDHWCGRAGGTCRSIQELCVHSKLNFSTGLLFHILEKFPNLIRLELNGMRSIFNDKDMQTIIKYLDLLQYLSISGCDKITDCGITGVPSKLCNELFSLSTIYSNGMSDSINKKVRSGRYKTIPLVSSSLISLRGLKSLKLIGSSQITDVGLVLAVQFRELKCLHLPWNDRISDWGIRKVCEYNPSLEALTLSGATVSTMGELKNIVLSHPRLQRKLCRVLVKYPDSSNIMSTPTVLTGIATSSELTGKNEAQVAGNFFHIGLLDSGHRVLVPTVQEGNNRSQQPDNPEEILNNTTEEVHQPTNTIVNDAVTAQTPIPNAIENPTTTNEEIETIGNTVEEVAPPQTFLVEQN